MIQVSQLTKYFGPIIAIRNVTFEVERGEIVGFLGLNGAGKTTTMRILSGYLPATSGTAIVAGYDVANQSLEVRTNIGYLQESVPLYPEMRVEEYLHFRAKLKGVDRSSRNSRIEECLEKCRIEQVRRRRIGTLSKGYRQRLGFADALVHNPPLLILDEPTAGMDPVQIRETLRLIRDLRAEHTILLSTHILSEVEAVCDRAIIIARGRVGLSQNLNELGADENARVLVDVAGPADQVFSALSRTPGVRSVTRITDTSAAPDSQASEATGVSKFELASAGDNTTLEVISKAIIQHGWGLTRIVRKRRTLEDAFFETLRHDELLENRQPAETRQALPT